MTSLSRRVPALLSAAILIAAASAQADVRLPKIFGDHMVLQQKLPIQVWGWADAGEEVTVSIGEKKATATAAADGKWKVTLDAMEAGGPVEMTVAGKNSITLTDVLVGEVWVGSGQSNMQWTVAASDNAEQEIAAADCPQIRLFTVARKVAAEPQEDVEGAWTTATPETVKNFSAVAYFFGRELHKELDVPVGMINTSWGGTIVEAWTSHETLQSDPDFQPILERSKNFQENNPNQASVLYNGMIKGLIPFGIRGAIWYQGESNVNRAEQYAELFPAFIADWRKNWGQGDFPFLFVQLAPFRYQGQDPRSLAELWEAQLKTLSVINTGMAVTTDIGNVKDIHPKNKQEVGRRLALWARAAVYGQDVVYSGPLYKSMQVEDNKVRLSFKHAEGGLVAKDGELTHFQIAGDDGEFVPAKATIEGETIVVSSDQVEKPAAVRFAWDDVAEPNLFNAAGLPASPFRTDTFPMVTAGKR